jgi:Arylsulfotransferase (ASST)
MLLSLAVLAPEFAARVRGGMPGTEHEGRMYADTLVEMTAAGQIVWEWRSWEHLDPADYPIVASQERRTEWTHGNSVEELPGGNLLLSFRTISTVAIVERATGAVVWTLGAPPLAQQHAPTRLPNGNLLIFDNGTHRVDHPLPHSRVIEVELATKRIVWSYQERRPFDFFSPFISNAQRLPNGNTLICEGNFGRLFEVTAEGEAVWEYVSPHIGSLPDLPDHAPGNQIFRAYRYGQEEVARWAGLA